MVICFYPKKYSVCLFAQSCPRPNLCNPMDSSVHGDSGAGILEWVSMHYPKPVSHSADGLSTEPQGNAYLSGEKSLNEKIINVCCDIIPNEWSLYLREIFLCHLFKQASL